MKLTLAMGLQYEHHPNHPSSGREMLATRLKAADHITDIEPVAVSKLNKTAAPPLSTSFEYPYYNLKAGLVFIPLIGTQLNITI